MKYPKSVLFIVCFEFCERFCYYGIRTILSLYLLEVLAYNRTTTTVVYHAYNMLMYFCPLIGGTIADSWLGNYQTVAYFTILCILGETLLSITSTPTLNLPMREFSMIGLVLIALGTGGIKACAVFFGGDQFKLPEQKAQLTTFFSQYFFAANAGSLVSAFITPILRKDVTCFGKKTCYPLAFLIPAILMIMALVIFLSGRKMYRRRKPQNNVTFNVITCITYAGFRKIISKEKRDHWLDHAEKCCDKRLIKETKIILNVIKLLLPVPLFWALHEQLASRWTFQGTHMNGEVFGYFIKPDQLQLANPLFFVIFVPILHIIVYPILEKFFFIDTPLKKLIIGGSLAGLSFIVSGIIELSLEPSYVVQPSNDLAQIRIFNMLDCNASINIGDEKIILEGLNMYKNVNIPVKGTRLLKFNAEYNNCQFNDYSPLIFSENLNIREKTASSWVLTNRGLSQQFLDPIKKSKSGEPLVRALIYADNPLENFSIRLNNGPINYLLNVTKNQYFTKFIQVTPNQYKLLINDIVITDDQSIKYGGVYTIIGYVSENTKILKTITTENPNSIHILWLLPQYILITIGEVMFKITAVEFLFTQSPVSMKSMMHAIWLLSIAFGDLIVIIIAKAQFFERQVYEIFLYAILMFVDMFIFSRLAKSYKYVEITSDESVNEILNKPNKDEQITNNENYNYEKSLKN